MNRGIEQRAMAIDLPCLSPNSHFFWEWIRLNNQCSTPSNAHTGGLPRIYVKASIEAPCETKPSKIALQKGLLVEFQKDSGRTVVGVMQNREGKKNWNVIDQNADTHIVRPKQIKLVVPGAHNFNPKDVNHLLLEAERLQDPSLLEIAWEELVSVNKTVNIEELATILYGSKTPEKCYSTYRLLLSYPVYFKCKDDGYSPIYEARPLPQVQQLQHQQLQEAIACRRIIEFAMYAKSIMQLPLIQKPTKSVWNSSEEFKTEVEALKAFSLDMCTSSEQRSTATQVLEELCVGKTPQTAVNVLIKIGYFGVHENLELLKLDIPTEFSTEVLAEADSIMQNPSIDPDEGNRIDLTDLKVYTIDCDDPDEIDDGLSAIQLPDGRLKVWIHVADPTRWIKWKSILQMEASCRCTSIYLPTLTIPMLPEVLGINLMSLRQGQHCPAVSVSVTLSHDGSVAESAIENSMICPSYKLSYDAASELLSLDLEEETELCLLFQAAKLRSRWRLSNGALNVARTNVKVQVKGEETLDPQITLHVDDPASPSSVLVSEMMILCGEVIATFGGQKRLCLPYRGQAFHEQMTTEIAAELESIPDGPARAFATFRYLSRSDMSFVKPLEHGCLGLPGYVQFTSPLRRYGDLMAHYQIKAILRGEDPPVSVRHVECSMAAVASRGKVVKRLQNDSDRYWVLEYLRRQPIDNRYRASLVRFEKDGTPIVLLLEVGLYNSVDLLSKKLLGDEFLVRVHDSQPRKSILVLKEVHM